jgi:PTH1 family peptidyl-tRNA hydrolase
MLLFVGLGNPGRDYAGNRHNVGAMAVEAILRRHRLPDLRRSSRPAGLFAEGRLDGEQVRLMQPISYMNESGRPVGEAMRYWRMAPEDVVVFHDELDLAAGKVRVKRGGGHAGHNGLRSIHQHVGDGYARVRLGIDHPGDKDRVIGHVLKDFSKAERQWVEKLMDAIGDHFPRLVKGDDGGFMSKVAADMAPPKPERKSGDDNNTEKDA